jgi:hypothetical protein
LTRVRSFIAVIAALAGVLLAAGLLLGGLTKDTPAQQRSPELKPAAPAPGKAPTVPTQAPSAQPPMPVSLEQALYLIRSTLLTLNDANRTGNYTVLHDLASPEFQARNTAADCSRSPSPLPSSAPCPCSTAMACCGSPASSRPDRCRSTSTSCSRTPAGNGGCSAFPLRRRRPRRSRRTRNKPSRPARRRPRYHSLCRLRKRNEFAWRRHIFAAVHASAVGRFCCKSLFGPDLACLTRNPARGLGDDLTQLGTESRCIKSGNFSAVHREQGSLLRTDAGPRCLTCFVQDAD